MAYLEFTPRTTYFQYTTAEAFESIVRGKQLWLNDLTKSNDPRDIVLGLETIRKLVTDVRHNEFQGYIGFPISLVMARIEGFFTSNRLFSACFTPEPDNINMWREYAARGTGLNIGFRPRALTDMHGRISNVRYVDDSGTALLREIIVQLFTPLLEDPMQEDLAEVFRTIDQSSNLITLINTVKHDSWRYEREMRLTFASGNREHNLEFEIPVSNFPDGAELAYVPPLVRMREGQELNYYSQPFGKYTDGHFDPSGAIAQVFIGPNSAWTPDGVEELLRSEGFRDFSISRSTCQFRP